MSAIAGASSTMADLAKLTVPQLKALCKERRIVGYSKLGKAALLQKLTAVTIHDNSGASHNTQRSGKRVTPLDHSTQIASPAQLETLPVSPLAHLVTPCSVPDRRSSSPKPVAGPRPEVPDQKHGTKRPQISAMFKSTKRQKSFSVDSVTIHYADSSRSMKSPVPCNETLTAQAVLTSVTESPPPASSCLPLGPSIPSNAVPVTIIPRCTKLVKEVGSSKRQGRFKPLVLTKTPVAATPVPPKGLPFKDSQAHEIARISSDTFNLETAPLSIPSFVNITLPPKLSDRKRVQGWAVILCALSHKDRQTCALVSRAFRYAVYLSAAHILARKYYGRRLDAIAKHYSQSTTNMWPYLRERQNEVAFWKHTFQNSFVGRYISALMIESLSARLWVSPDDEKQVVVALRFVLTRLWFTLSVGTNGTDPSGWLKYTVEDAQEVVKGEIWAITIRDGSSLSVFHVLESTCEVIGWAPNAPQLEVYSCGLRLDWSEYLLSYTGTSAESYSLILKHLRWANYAEYDRGVSRHWLHRISGEGDIGLSKKVVAERYVMACVVANSISGQWMSSNQMAQEFAGLPSIATLETTRGRTPKINLYLPALHHVESVHFTTPEGGSLHPALAVVQTAAREYIILKDNGMQVGCEEDGVADVWMQVLGCDNHGIAIVCFK